MTKLSINARLGVVLVLVILLIGISYSQGEKDKIPITTSSEQALEHFLKGRTLSDNIRNQDAREYYKKAIEADPNFALALLNLANSEVTFTDYFTGLDKAKAVMDNASEGEQLLIKASVAAINNNPLEVREIWLKLVEMYPNDERVHTSLAGSYYGQQEYDKAIEHYNQALTINPSFAPSYNMVGYSHWQVESYDEAEKAFKKYIELIPNDPNPHDSYGELLLKMGRFDESIAQYQNALKVDPNFSISRFGVSANLCMKNDYEKAHIQLDSAFALARDDGERRGALTAKAIVCVDEGKMDMALKALDKRYVIAQAANDTITMGNDLGTMGFVHLESGQYEKAAEKFNESRDMIVNADVKTVIKDQAETNYLFNMARIHINNGKFKKAKENAQGCMVYAGKIQNQNSTRLAHQLIAMISLEEKDYDRVITELNQSNLLNPYNLYRLGLAYEGKGEIEEAKKYFDKAANFNAVNSLSYSLIRKKASSKLASL